MNWLDRILLLATGACALFTMFKLISRRQKGKADLYHIIALSVLLVSGLLLVVFGWDILGLMGSGLSNRLVAIVASLIPFSWATGVVVTAFPKADKGYLALMSVGLALIVLSRFLDNPAMARVVYPIFHGTAGLTIVVLPILTRKRSSMRPTYLLVSLGGLLISVGGLALSFLLAGRQLAFFSTDLVLMILAPLLLLVTIAYSTGLLVGTPNNSTEKNEQG
jgi:hypothetical protein